MACNGFAPKRAYGGGSVYRPTIHGRWTVAIDLAPSPDGRRRRKQIRFASREDAEAALPGLIEKYRGIDGASLATRSGHVITDEHPRLLSQLEVAQAVLARARSLGWSDDTLALAIVAGLTYNRRRFGIVGPCVYCGDELADTVDHIDPSKGHADGNTVSACRPCNTDKGRRTPEQWFAEDAA